MPRPGDRVREFRTFRGVHSFGSAMGVLSCACSISSCLGSDGDLRLLDLATFDVSVSNSAAAPRLSSLLNLWWCCFHPPSDASLSARCKLGFDRHHTLPMNMHPLPAIMSIVMLFVV